LFFLLHKSFRDYPGPERKYSIHSSTVAYFTNFHICCRFQHNKNVLQAPQSEIKVNIWEIKPPDFSYKLYTSLRLPEKPSRTIKEEERRKKSIFPGTMLHFPSIRNHPNKAMSPKFITTFPHLDSHKVKLIFVESGKYPNGVYLNPKPHNFQQEGQQNTTERFITYKPHECTWDSMLILPKALWPIKSVSHT
ncbi:hypothetical protein E2I00_000412, partial [Balaenoptera physalus]